MDKYVHPIIQNEALTLGTLIAQSPQDVSNIALFSLLFRIKEIADCLSQYIRLIDYYSLKRVSKNFSKILTFFSTIYKIDNLVDVQLKGESLFDLANRTEGVISGSFMLRLLLATPYSMPHWINEDIICNSNSGVIHKYEPSDIDIYSHGIVAKTCSTCKANMNHISKISIYLCNGKSHSGHNGPNNSQHDKNNYSDIGAIFDAWKFMVDEPNSSRIIYNDILLYGDDDIADFIESDFDLNFCKNFYDNGVLHICHPETVLKMSCSYNGKKRPVTIENIFRRIIKYNKRGFHIELSGKLLKDFIKYKEREENYLNSLMQDNNSMPLISISIRIPGHTNSA